MDSNSSAIRSVATAVVRSRASEWTNDGFYSSGDLAASARVRLFSGLICRIKHAFLWGSAPLTMRRLTRARVLLPVFAHYASDVGLEHLAKLGVDERTRRFLSAIAEPPGPPFAPLVRQAGASGVAAHELRLFEMAVLTRRGERTSPACHWALDWCKPSLRYQVTSRIQGFSCRPDADEVCLCEALPTAEVILAYGHSGASEVRDPLTKALLRSLAAPSSFPDLMHAMGGWSLAAEELGRLVAGQVRVGTVSVEQSLRVSADEPSAS